jgi:hypothetical protein
VASSHYSSYPSQTLVLHVAKILESLISFATFKEQGFANTTILYSNWYILTLLNISYIGTVHAPLIVRSARFLGSKPRGPGDA